MVALEEKSGGYIVWEIWISVPNFIAINSF